MSKTSAHQLLHRKASRTGIVEDFFITPNWTSQILFNNVQDCELSEDFWECACGNGAISKVGELNCYKVISTDAVNRGYGTVENFYTAKATYSRTIITNPPFIDVNKFVLRALLMPDVETVCMLLRQGFMESKKRYHIFQDFMPYKIIIISDRVESNTEVPGGQFALAWYIWKNVLRTHERHPYAMTVWDAHPLTKKTNQKRIEV